MRLRRAYGVLLFFFSLFLAASFLSPVVGIPKSVIGGIGLDLGAFFFKKAGIFCFVVPLVGVLLSLGLIFGSFFRSFILSLYLVLFFFMLELVIALWFPAGPWGGLLAPKLSRFLQNSIGLLGSNLLLLGVMAALFMAFGFDERLMRILRRKRSVEKVGEVKKDLPVHRPEPSSSLQVQEPVVVGSGRPEKSKEKDEKASEGGADRGEEKKGSGDPEGLKIVEGGGELAEVLTPKSDVEESANEDEVVEDAVKRPSKGYRLPTCELLEFVKKEKKKVNPKELEAKAALLEEKLKDFGVSGKVVSVHYGPVVSMFEYKPAPGIKVSKILNLQDDIAVVMKAGSVRVVAPIPGKDTIGIELPNDERETVYFSEIVCSDVFKEMKTPLPLVLGKDIFGKPFVSDLRKMPHLLVAGATGSGKSVSLNAMICSILFKSTPDMVKFILVDPKMLEFSVYNGIPHLITPVITDPKKAATALSWAVGEMERRYRMLSEAGVRNIERYNAKAENKVPYIVVVIDELADLMMVAGKDVELHIARLAQKARAAGIHLIVATQRPSVDVITGLIKANFPSRISFKVSSKVDSRTILDTIGAEKLLGNGDMLFMPPGRSDLIRLHGAYISDREIEVIAEFWKKQAEPEYDESIFEKPTVNGLASSEGNAYREDYDELYDEAVEFVSNLGYASASLLQRHFKIGYNRAARLIEMMEKEGIVGPAQGSKPREVLVRKSPKINLPDDVAEE